MSDVSKLNSLSFLLYLTERFVVCFLARGNITTILETVKISSGRISLNRSQTCSLAIVRIRRAERETKISQEKAVTNH